MIKQSKITVKHYLNLRLKPEIDNKIKFYPLYLSITYDRMNIRVPSQLNAGIFQVSENDFLKNKIDKEILFKMNYEIDLIKRCVLIFQTDEDFKQLKKDYYLLYPSKKYRSKNERLNIFSSYIDFYTHSIYDVVSENLFNELKTKVLEIIKSDLKNLDLLDNNKMKSFLNSNNTDLYDFIIKNNLDFKYKMYFILLSKLNSFLSFQGRKFGYDLPYIDWKQGKGQIIFKEYLMINIDVNDWQNDFFNIENINNCIELIENIINKDNYLKILFKIY